MDFSKYLETLPISELSALYDSPWTCQAVLRSLPVLSQQFVLRMLHISAPVTDEAMKAMVTAGCESKATNAIGVLKRLQVVRPQPASIAAKKHSGWVLEPTFRDRLRRSVMDPKSLGQHSEQVCISEALPSASELSEFAHSQWESLLMALVTGSRNHARNATMGLAALDRTALLAAAHLLDSGRQGANITGLGFKFLFMDAFSQLWLLMQQYVTDASTRSGLALSDVLSFLLQLAFRKASQPLRAEGLSAGQKEVAGHMSSLGLLKPFKNDGELWLFPTFLATLLCGSTTAVASSHSDVGGFIVVETSFRVYAYTSSPVQIAVLQLFTRTECILPNVYVGTLTTASITAALKRGIDAGMIVSYLEQHRHPQVAHRRPVIPEAVRDQILLWEGETHRMRCKDATLYEDFPSKLVFDKAVAKAKALGALLFDDAALMRLVVEAHAHPSMRNAIKEFKAN